MRDVSNWLLRGPGGNGTLPMEILLSPNGSIYYMKYAWQSDTPRTHLEDVNEVIAAKIAQLLQLETIEVEIAWRDGKRGCLSLDYVEQYDASEDEAGAVLLEMELGERYHALQQSSAEGQELIKASFNLLEKLSYIDKIRSSFIAMNLFDILIGNQDRHPYNWSMLFKRGKSFFGPLYDNGASLGFQLPDKTLEKMVNDTNELEKYYNNMKVKAGIFNSRKPPVKAIDVLSYCISYYNDEVKEFEQFLLHFSFERYDAFIDEFPLFTKTRKQFLKLLIRHRREKILSAIKEGI